MADLSIINKKYHSLEGLSEAFRTAKPFPHIALDDFLDPDYFATLKEFFQTNSEHESTGRAFDTDAEDKKWISLNSNLPKEVSAITEVLNSEDWVENLLKLTGMKSLNATPHGNTKLANYHEMEPGGFLGPHVDHSFEPETGLPHVLNNLVYLSPEWSPEYGGATLLYDRWGKNIVRKVEYKPNRSIIFLHTPYSFHCVERLSEKHKPRRKSIYVDYYSSSFDPYEGLDLDFSDKWFKHGTTFKLERFGDYLKPKNKNYTKALLQYNFRRFFA